MKLSHAIPLLAVPALLLTGCTGTDKTVEATPTLSVSPAQTPTPTATGAVKNARGNIIKRVGQMAGNDAVVDNSSLKFKVTKIEPIKCDAPYTSAKPNGIPLAITIEVETTADFVGGLNINGTPGLISFAPHYWKGYAANGTRMNAVDTLDNQSCLMDRNRLLPESLGKGEKATGIVILDVTTPTGSIAYDGAGSISSNGWEWQYPAT